MIRIEVTLNADSTAISPVVEGIMEMARRLECAAGKEFEIETALREALANAIVHGCKNDPTKKVQCCVGCDEERGMLIVVRDPGSGFDPFDVPDPCNGENVYLQPRPRHLPDQSAHGRGTVREERRRNPHAQVLVPLRTRPQAKRSPTHSLIQERVRPMTCPKNFGVIAGRHSGQNRQGRHQAALSG